MSDTLEKYVNKKDDLQMKINSALTTAECQVIGVTDTVKLSTPLNVSTQGGVLTIYDYTKAVTAKPEQIYVDSYYNEYHVNINKWAKFKPTDYPSRSAGSAVTYVGADGLCGLDCAPSTNLQTVIDRVRLGNYDWAYSKRPNGVGQSFYRMLDFEFYNHNSVKPLYPLGDLYGNIGSGSLQKRYFNDPANGVTLNLHLNQMSYQGVSFADMYWAIVFIDSNNNLHAVVYVLSLTDWWGFFVRKR